MIEMAVSWCFIFLGFFCLCPLLERPEIVLCSFGSIGTCRDRFDATVWISNHSLALRHPLNNLGVSHQMANFTWMISAVYCQEHVECQKPSYEVPFLTSLK